VKIHKKRISVLLVLVVFLMPCIAQVQAQQITLQPIVTINPLPPQITSKIPAFTINPDGYSAFATITPQIDGAISSGFNYAGEEVPGEWSDAVKIDFILNVITQPITGEVIEPHNATLYIKNDYINLYMALVIRNEEYSQSDMIHFLFDNTNNQAQDTGDDFVDVHGGGNSFHDWHYSSDGYYEVDPEQNGVGAAQWYSSLKKTPIYTIQPITFLNLTKSPTAANKASQETIKPIQPIKTIQPIQPSKTIQPISPIITLSPIGPIITKLKPEPLKGTWVFEIAHPLNSGDDLHDLNAAIGDTIGISTAYWDNAGHAGTGGFPSFYEYDEMLEYTIAGSTILLGSVDLSIDWIEVNQAVQDSSNSLPLAQGKTTVARVYLDTGPASGPVDATVFLYARDPDTTSTLPGPLVASVSAPVTPLRTQITHTANFLLPTSWVSRQHLELRAFVTSGTYETNHNNNWLDPNEQFTFHKLRTLNVYIVPVNNGTAAAPNMVSDAFITTQEEAMRATYPMEINFVRLEPLLFSGTYPDLITELNEIAGQLVLAWVFALAITGEEPNFPLPDLIYGFYPDWWEFIHNGWLYTAGGISNPTWSTSPGQGIAGCGYIGSSAELTMAHENNHNLDRSADGTWGRHAGPDGANCDAAGPDPDWPYANDDIQEIGLDTSVWPPRIVLTNKPDFMSYCDSPVLPTKWISPYRWEHLFAEYEESPEYPPFAVPLTLITTKGMGSVVGIGVDNANLPSLNALLQDPEPGEPAQALQVSGWVSLKDGVFTGKIESIFIIDVPTIVLANQLKTTPHLKSLVGNIVLKPAEFVQPKYASSGINSASYQDDDEEEPAQTLPNPFELVAFGPDDDEVFSFPFRTSFVHHEGYPLEQVSFTYYLPFNKALIAGAKIGLKTASVQMELGSKQNAGSMQGEFLDIRTVSQSPPVVKILTPSGGEKFSLKEKIMISWSGDDDDNDPLLYSVQYSPDGKFWIPLATRVKDNVLYVDPNNIPGSARGGSFVRVFASDGFNTGTGQNEKSFFVPNKPPKVYIDSPPSGQTFGYGDIIPLKGHGFDLEDGRLPESALTWEFEGGHLGNGSAIDVVRLGPGDYIITLVGKDSLGLKGTASIKLHVSKAKIIPALLALPITRAGGGLSLSASMEPSMIEPGDGAVLQVAVENFGLETAQMVELVVHLPRGLSLASDSKRMAWKVINPGESVETAFKLTGKEKGRYSIGLEVIADNYKPAMASVILEVGGPPSLIIKPVTMITSIVKSPDTSTTTIPRTEEEENPPIDSEPTNTTSFTSVTVTKKEPQIPGFEVLPALTAVAFLLGIRRRRRRR